MMIVVFFSLVSLEAADLDGRDYAVELTAGIATSPPEIRLAWRPNATGSGYIISRKSLAQKNWTEIARLDGQSAGFIDRNVQIGIGYEYQVIRESTLDYKAYGYIYSGINLPVVDDRGIIILLTERNLAQALELELSRLEFDLIGDGWSVERHTVSSTNSPVEVKTLIQSIYAKNPGRTRALLLFGHVPVAYAGNIMPDGHDIHHGAWPADVFYADVDGAWTDGTVDTREAEQPRNWNVPGDGKFDQSEPPSEVELQTGRVDFSNLTCFLNKTPARSEIDLARGYLDKNHRFRTGLIPVARRAIIFDRLESKTAEPIAAAAWRNFAPFVGGEIERIADFEYFPRVSSGTYLWSGVCAGGSYTHSDHVGTSDAFALNNANVVFTTFLGSFYGDWDVESAFLRSALGGNGALLTTVYSGQPQWIFHPMALGETIGYSARITQDNGTNGVYAPHNNGAGEVHVALIGDPSLRAHPIPQVKNLTGQMEGSSMVLSWQPPEVEGFAGVLIYRAASPKGPYQRLTPDPVAGSRISIFNPDAGGTFMVKAVALTRSPSGSYYNASVGTLYPDPLADLVTTVPAVPENLAARATGPSSIMLTWVSASANNNGFNIQRWNPATFEFEDLANLAPDGFSYEDRALPAGGSYTYRICAYNQAGPSAFSNEATASTLSASAEFVGLDTNTRGNWIGRYGRETYIIPGLHEELPPFVSLTVSNLLVYKRGLEDVDTRAVQLTDSESRSANCWVSGGTTMAFHFNFTDDKVHQLGIYTASWGTNKPVLKLHVVDASSGTVLDERTLQDVDNGVHIVYNVRRQLSVQITPPSFFTNVEVYAFFIDPVAVAPVQIDPSGGSFPGRTQINMTTPSAGSEIFYTLDGTEPTRQSQRFNGPFWLRNGGSVKARAFKDGYQDSPLTQAEFQNSLINLAAFVSDDPGSGGNWPARYGKEGYWVTKGGKSIPLYAEVSVEDVSEWSWTDIFAEGDARAPFLEREGPNRQASAWYAKDSFTVDLGVFDTRMHTVSFYFVDYDRGNRAQTVELLDTEGNVRDKFLIQNFGDGRYLTLAVQGQLRVRVKNSGGANALLSGIFFDAAPEALSSPKPVPLTELASVNGRMSFNLAVFPGQRVCTDLSTDLIQWRCYSTNLATGTSLQIGVQLDEFEKGQFFRTHFVP